MTHCDKKENIVFTHHFKGGFGPDQQLVMKGKVSEDPKRISINLQEKELSAENVTLHIDFRFDYGGDKETIVCNNRANGELGDELRPSKRFPFQPSEDYVITISRQSNMYSVAVDDLALFQFNQRPKSETADWLVVYGDTTVTSCKIVPFP